MEPQDIIDLCRRHTLYDWAATDQYEPLVIDRAQGIYLWDGHGKRYLDFNSQLMSVAIGHGHPRVIAAMTEQMQKLLYAWPGSATEPRARLGQRLAQLLPGDLDTVFFTLGGAEANENALRISRLYSGKKKVMSRYRSYHGATMATAQLTGDPRRLANEPGPWGFIKVLDPTPFDFSFGTDPATITSNHLRYLEEVIVAEGAETIAAFFVETVTGTNGILPPPPGWLVGVRELCTRYGILLVCDEVMCGFGRTGKMFAFEHGPIVPDLVTMAKGLTSSYLPLGAVAMRRPIADHFRTNVFWGGLTYNSHPLALATAMAVLDVLEDENLVNNAARLEPVMRQEMRSLAERHPSVLTHRNIGLFGVVEIGDGRGKRLVPYRGSHPAMGALRKRLLDLGIFTLTWGNMVFCNPPLCITEEELKGAFAALDQALLVTDDAIASN